MDHSELVQEMLLLEKMTAQERLKHARRRRQQQLKSWLQREPTISNGNAPITTSLTNGKSSHFHRSPSKRNSVKFPENIVLLEATARQDIDEVRQLLQSGKYNPNTSNEDGLTPIHQCSIDNSEKILKLFIEYGGDVNSRDRDLWTPLHAAATCGHVQICRILIENGAELLALNADGNMPYDICDEENALDYIETQMDRIGITQEMIDQTRAKVENQMLIDLQSLVKKRAHTSIRSIDDILSYRNEDGATPLHIASANGYQNVVKYLLSHNVSINLLDNDRWAPMHAAAFWCQQIILGQLIEAGADIYEKIPDGRSALELCDDSELRTYMVDFREQVIRNQEKAAAAAAAAQLQPKVANRTHLTTNSLANGTTTRVGTLYESRSSVSSPYGSGSSLNRTSSIRRASIRDREKVKKLNENFLDVLQAKDKIQEDNDEPTSNLVVPNGIIVPIGGKLNNKEEQTSSVTTATDSTIREPLPTKKSVAPIAVGEANLPPLKVPPPLPPPPPPTQTTADTLSEVKRRREERRRGIAGSSSIPPTVHVDSPLKTNETNTKISNGTHAPVINDPLQRYTSPKHVQIKDYHVTDDDREKRICCTIL